MFPRRTNPKEVLHRYSIEDVEALDRSSLGAQTIVRLIRSARWCHGVVIFAHGSGSLSALSKRYPAPEVTPAQLMMRQTVTIGAVVYKCCMTLGMLPEGLYLARGSKRTLIPWREVRHIGHTTLYWRQIPLVSIGEPTITSIGLPAAFENAICQHRNASDQPTNASSQRTFVQ